MFVSGDYDPELTFNSPIFIVVSVLNSYVYCLLGAIVTDNGLRLSDILYNSMWQDLSNANKKSLILMIVNMDRPMIFDGLYVLPLNLITFTAVW